VDLDKDGHGDLLSGGWDGELWVFRGAGGGKFEAREELKDAKGKVIKPGSASTVHAVDWDGDGDLDLFAGNIDGDVLYHANEGSDAEPRYAEAEAVKAGGRTIKVPGGDSGAVAVDWDGDKTLDLLLGCGDGSVQWCRGKPDTSPIELEAPEVLVKAPEGSWGSGTGVRAKVCAADCNGDGKLDLLLGSYGREKPEPKELSEEEKMELAELEKQEAEVQKEFETAMKELMKVLEEEVGYKEGKEPTEEMMKSVTEFLEGDHPAAKKWKSLTEKMGEIQMKSGKMKGQPQAVGWVWMFPRH
jgi:hypothetical protein